MEAFKILAKVNISWASNSHLSFNSVGIIIELSLISIMRNNLLMALNSEPLVSVMGIFDNISTSESLSSVVMLISVIIGGGF